MDISFLQGTTFHIKVNYADATLILFDGTNRYTLTNPVIIGNEYYLEALPEITKDWKPGVYKFQIIEDGKLFNDGRIKIKANLLYSSNEAFSYWENVLKAVDERLAGRSLDPALNVSVGDKSISYMTLDELIKLRNFALDRIAEEAKEEGVETFTKNDQQIIKLVWR